MVFYVIIVFSMFTSIAPCSYFFKIGFCDDGRGPAMVKVLILVYVVQNIFFQRLWNFLQTVPTFRCSDMSQLFGSCKLDHGEPPVTRPKQMPIENCSEVTWPSDHAQSLCSSLRDWWLIFGKKNNRILEDPVQDNTVCVHKLMFKIEPVEPEWLRRNSSWLPCTVQ